MENNFQNRITDINETPWNLPPVLGWKNAPDVSLNQAVRNLKIDDIVDYAEFSLEFADTFSIDNQDTILTKDQIGSINLYTQEVLYKSLNSTLNKRDRNLIKPFFPFLKLIFTALDKLPNYDGVVYRGIKPTTDIYLLIIRLVKNLDG